jgi:hypothetical protein
MRVCFTYIESLTSFDGTKSFTIEQVVIPTLKFFPLLPNAFRELPANPRGFGFAGIEALPWVATVSKHVSARRGDGQYYYLLQQHSLFVGKLSPLQKVRAVYILRANKEQRHKRVEIEEGSNI